MFNKWFHPSAHKYLHFVGCLLIGVGLPLNKVVMSIGTIWVISNIVFEADYRSYLGRLKRNTLFLSIAGIFILHFIGILWSEDYSYAFGDIRSKLPLLIIPLALIARPLEKEFLPIVLNGLLVSLLITSTINLSTFYFSNHFTDGTDIRFLSLFGSHIRYGLLALFGVIIAFSKFNIRNIFTWIWALIGLWLVFYTFVAQVMSVYFAAFFLVFALSIYYIFKLNSKRLKTLLLLTFATCLAGFVFFIYSELKPSQTTESFEHLETRTSFGNNYYHDTTLHIQENGHYVMLYIQEEELAYEWNKKSNIPHDSLDLKGQELMGTLIRYMTSKGLRKDAGGFERLSKKDIRNIEQGIPSYRYVESPLTERLDGIKHQIQYYLAGGHSSGHSLLQRFEHWKASIYILKKNWLIGVGTGDVQQQFNHAYRAIDTDLAENQRNRAHNQYMTFWVSFGILGLILLLLFSWQLVFQAISNKSLIALSFGLITIASFLPEDTLETQQGVTFVAFFIGLLPAFGSKKEI